MSCITRLGPLKGIGQLHFERADIAPRPPLQFSFNATLLSSHPPFLLKPVRLGCLRLSAGIGHILSRHFQIDDDWLSAFKIGFFTAIYFI